MREPVNASAAALVEGIREGTVSAWKVAEAFLDRAEAVNPGLNAVVELRTETTQTDRGRDETLDAILRGTLTLICVVGALVVGRFALFVVFR